MFINGLVFFKNGMALDDKIDKVFLYELKELSKYKSEDDFKVYHVDLFTAVADSLINFANQFIGLRVNRLIYSDNKKRVGFGFDYTVSDKGTVGVFGLETVEGFNDLLSRRNSYHESLKNLHEEIKEHNLPVGRAPHPLIDNDLLSVKVGLEKQNYTFIHLFDYYGSEIRPVNSNLSIIVDKKENERDYFAFLETVRLMHDKSFLSDCPSMNVLISVEKGNDKYVIVELNKQQGIDGDTVVYKPQGSVYELKPTPLYRPFNIEKFVNNVEKIDLSDYEK